MSYDKISFFKAVHEVAKLIPNGRVTSYGAIASYLGTKQASRTVGYAMNASHNDPSIPAHRVVNRKGILTGRNHFSDPLIMQEKLEAEGHKVVDHQIKDFDKSFWDPSKELL